MTVIGHTERGFADYLNARDCYGAEVVVRESSSANEDHVWIFVRGGSVLKNSGSALLDTEGARAMIAALQSWLDGDR